MAGDVTMLIWLGKQLLGQKDQRHMTGAISHTHDAAIAATDALIDAAIEGGPLTALPQLEHSHDE